MNDEIRHLIIHIQELNASQKAAIKEAEKEIVRELIDVIEEDFDIKLNTDFPCHYESLLEVAKILVEKLSGKQTIKLEEGDTFS